MWSVSFKFHFKFSKNCVRIHSITRNLEEDSSTTHKNYFLFYLYETKNGNLLVDIYEWQRIEFCFVYFFFLFFFFIFVFFFKFNFNFKKKNGIWCNIKRDIYMILNVIAIINIMNGLWTITGIKRDFCHLNFYMWYHIDWSSSVDNVWQDFIIRLKNIDFIINHCIQSEIFALKTSALKISYKFKLG